MDTGASSHLAYNTGLPDRKAFFRCDSTRDLYPVTQQPSSQTPVVLLSFSSTTWHRRSGHPGDDVLRRKHVKLPFYNFESSVNSLFEIIHSDTWTSPILSESEIKYYAIFLDHFSHFVWVYPLHKKSNLFDNFVAFRAYVNKQFNVDIKALQCDHGGEYDNTRFHDLFRQNGIQFRFSCPHTLQQNVKSERSAIAYLLIRGSTYELGFNMKGSTYESGLDIRGSTYELGFKYSRQNTPAKYSRQALFFTIKADSILSSQAHTLLSSQPPPHSPPPRSTATRWSDIIKLLSARVKEEMWCCEHHANLTVMPGTQDRGCGYFMWMDDLRLHISSSSGSSTPPSYSPGTSTRPSYSPGSSRSAQNLGKAECSNCKFLAEKIKTLEAKIKILEGALEMERHPEKHTLDSAAILHELYNEMGKLSME
ncbi:ribonuclease H-like domain-containing protein [Tanacetum coccineum]